jgi:aminocarboxymuconate-semialdehyde decarboxylase
LIDFTADTTRAIATLLYSNTFARTPNVSYVFSHAGGTVPYLAGRFDIVDQMNVIPGAEHRNSAAMTFRRLYWDTALSWTDPVLRMLRSTVGLDQVLFGTDYPYLQRDLALSTRQRLLDTPELSPADQTNILGATATKLIPRLGSQRKRPG